MGKFALKNGQKNQKFKAASASLLSPYTPLFALPTRFAQTATLSAASFRSLALRSPDRGRFFFFLLSLPPTNRGNRPFSTPVM